MQARVDEIAPDTYRISAFHPGFKIQFNQFLIVDDLPFLMHTGFKGMFATTLEGVKSLMDPSRLRWIGFSHFESDECGALNEWLRVAPEAQAACSLVGTMVNVNDFAERPGRPLADGEILETGRHRLRFLSTPHVPHSWDAGLFFDEGHRTLLCSDLFFHPGDPEPVAGLEIVGRAEEAIKRNLAGPMAKDLPYTPYTGSTFERLAALAPSTMAVMHGASFAGDGRKALLELSAVITGALGSPEDAG